MGRGTRTNKTSSATTAEEGGGPGTCSVRLSVRLQDDVFVHDRYATVRPSEDVVPHCRVRTLRRGMSLRRGRPRPLPYGDDGDRDEDDYGVVHHSECLDLSVRIRARGCHRSPGSDRYSSKSRYGARRSTFVPPSLLTPAEAEVEARAEATETESDDDYDGNDDDGEGGASDETHIDNDEEREEEEEEDRDRTSSQHQRTRRRTSTNVNVVSRYA